MAVAPDGFGPFSKRLLVGNFGDGTLVAFGLKSGRQRGYLRGRGGQAIQINGLWGLAFGNGESLGRANYLYFTAGAERRGRWTVRESALGGRVR